MCEVRRPVLTKADCYSRIVTGEFGNTLPRWIGDRDRHEWCYDASVPGAPALWGVQHTTLPGFPGTKLNVPTARVLDTILDGGFGDDYCISPMITSLPGLGARWEGDVSRDEVGRVYCSGSSNPAPGSWRTHMKSPKLWTGASALALLRTVLNENSFDDLMLLLDAYPGHVVELSATDKCYGTVPGRNAVIWEVRKY